MDNKYCEYCGQSLVNEIEEEEDLDPDGEETWMLYLATLEAMGIKPKEKTDE